MLFIKCEGRCFRTEVLGQLELRSRTGFVRFNHVRRPRVSVSDFPCFCRKEQRSTHLGRQRSIHAFVHQMVFTGQSIHLHFHNMKQLCKSDFNLFCQGFSFVQLVVEMFSCSSRTRWEYIYGQRDKNIRDMFPWSLLTNTIFSQKTAESHRLDCSNARCY